jgi:hypothetical protein
MRDETAPASVGRIAPLTVDVGVAVVPAIGAEVALVAPVSGCG